MASDTLSYGNPETSSNATQKGSRIFKWIASLRQSAQVLTETDIRQANHRVEQATMLGRVVGFARHGNYPPIEDISALEETSVVVAADEQVRHEAKRIAQALKDAGNRKLTVVSTATSRAERTADIIAEVLVDEEVEARRIEGASLCVDGINLVRGVKSLLKASDPDELLFVVGHQDTPANLGAIVKDGFGMQNADWDFTMYDSPEFL